MTKVTLLQTEDPITLVTPPNISEFLKAQLNDGKPGAALVKDVEAQIEQAASDAFGKEYVFRAAPSLGALCPVVAYKKRHPKGRLFNFGLGWVNSSLSSQLRRRNLQPLFRCLHPLQGAQIL